MDVLLIFLQQLFDATMPIFTKVLEECTVTFTYLCHERLQIALKAKGGPTLYQQCVPKKESGEYKCQHKLAGICACVIHPYNYKCTLLSKLASVRSQLSTPLSIGRSRFQRTNKQDANSHSDRTFHTVIYTIDHFHQLTQCGLYH